MILFWGLFFAVGILSRELKNEREERKRYQNNTESLLQEKEAFQTKEGKWAMTVQALEFNKKELEQYREDDAKLIASLGVKIKRLESMTTVGTVTDIHVTAPIIDKPPDPILNDSIRLRGFEWSNPWTRISGTLSPDSVSLLYQNTDTLKQFVYRIPRQFLFIKWGTKAIHQTVHSSNPNTKIIYDEYIELK